MIGALISLIAFIITIPLSTTAVALKALEVQMQKKQGSKKLGGHNKVLSKFKEKIDKSKKPKTEDDKKNEAKMLALKTLRLGLLVLVRFIRSCASVLAFLCSFTGVISVFVILVLIASVSSILLVVDGDFVASGGTSTIGGTTTESSDTVLSEVSADTQAIINMSESEVWQLISEGKYSSYDDANSAAQSNWSGEESFWKGLLVTVEVPCWKWDYDSSSKIDSTISIQVNKHLEGYFKDFMTEIYNQPEQYCIKEVGGFKFRAKNNGTGTKNLSGHSFGATLDINWTVDGMGSVPVYGDSGYPFKSASDLSEPQKSQICAFDSSWLQIAIKYKLDWGGFWSEGSLDPMHFSLVGDRNKDTRKSEPKYEGR